MKKPLLIFILLSLVLAAVFFLFPIAIFDGIILVEEPGRSYEVEAPLSLSYFVGIGYSPEDMTYVGDFYLTAKGWIMAFIFVLGLPGLLAYRVYLKQFNK